MHRRTRQLNDAPPRVLQPAAAAHSLSRPPDYGIILSSCGRAHPLSQLRGFRNDSARCVQSAGLIPMENWQLSGRSSNLATEHDLLACSAAVAPSRHASASIGDGDRTCLLLPMSSPPFLPASARRRTIQRSNKKGPQHVLRKMRNRNE